MLRNNTTNGAVVSTKIDGDSPAEATSTAVGLQDAFDTLQRGLFSVEKRLCHRTNQSLGEASCGEAFPPHSSILHSVAQANERCPKPYSSSARMHRDCTSHMAGSKKGQD